MKYGVKPKKAAIWLIVVFAASFVWLSAKDYRTNKNKPVYQSEVKSVTVGYDGAVSLVNINGISSFFGYDGLSGHNLYTGNSGILYPRGLVGAIYQDGIVWGGRVNTAILGEPEIRVGGATYDVGTSPGWVDGSTPADPLDPAVRIYRVRDDLSPYDDSVSEEELIQDASEVFNLAPELVTADDIQILREQYFRDWNEWPVDKGAPYYDLNDNGSYDAGTWVDLNGDGIQTIDEIERPGIGEADQILWLAVNDFDTNIAEQLYGSPSIGLEVQTTVWAYDNDILEGVFFKKYDITNKSGADIDGFYVTQWSDPDLGAYSNDFVGCDSNLALGYGYNGLSTDSDYDAMGLIPAAVGYQLLQGPLVAAPGDSGFANFERVYGYRNLGMTSFGYSSAGDEWTDPLSGDYDEGTLSWYNGMQGYRFTSSGGLFPYLDENEQPTFYPLSGDPETSTGDVDGRLTFPGDRRMHLNAGPILLSSGEKQTYIYATLATMGNNYLNSVTRLKDLAGSVLNKYHSLNGILALYPDIAMDLTSDSNVVTIAWNDIDATYSHPDYTLLGYELCQLNPENTDEYIGIAFFDKIDGITEVYDGDELVYEGDENGLTTTYSTAYDALGDMALQFGETYAFGIRVYLYNSNASTGNVVIRSDIEFEKLRLIHEAFEMSFTSDHTLGDGNGSIDVQVTDIFAVKQHSYSFSVQNTGSNMVGQLRDETLQIDVGEPVEFYGPVTQEYPSEGFSLAIDARLGYYDWDYSGDRWVSGVDWGGLLFFGGMDHGSDFFGSTLNFSDAVDIRLEFQDSADVDANGFISSGALYRRDLGYAHEGTGMLPFAAYDISTPSSPRRLNICFIENDFGDGTTTANAIWDMGWDGEGAGTGWGANGGDIQNFGAREYIFIMDSDYDGGVNYNDDFYGPSADVHLAIWPKERGNRPYLLAPFTMEIHAESNPLGMDEADVFEFSLDLTSINDRTNGLVRRFSLGNNYPNPFNPSTTIPYAIDRSGMVEIEVFNILGQKVDTVFKGHQVAGVYQSTWDASDYASGMYIIRLKSEQRQTFRKVMLLK
jgi:hypothetical protein